MSENNSKSVFETLSAVNVNDHIKGKNGLSYLPWAWAWGTLKTYYPDATYKVYEDENGWTYHTDGRFGLLTTPEKICPIPWTENVWIRTTNPQRVRSPEQSRLSEKKQRTGKKQSPCRKK